MWGGSKRVSFSSSICIIKHIFYAKSIFSITGHSVWRDETRCNILVPIEMLMHLNTSFSQNEWTVTTMLFCKLKRSHSFCKTSEPQRKLNWKEETLFIELNILNIKQICERVYRFYAIPCSELTHSNTVFGFHQRKTAVNQKSWNAIPECLLPSDSKTIL